MRPNMDYCKYENTLAALRQCQEAMTEFEGQEDLSESEERAKRQLLELCRMLAQKYLEEV